MNWFTRCQHIRTRCLHGDEVWANYMRFSYRGRDVPRQLCLDCGRALDRGLPPICTVLGTPHGDTQ